MNEEINKLIEEKIEELYNSLMEKPLKVLDIFNNFFGEELVDMQGYMSLETFKLWMDSARIDKIVRNKEVINMSKDEWDTCKYKTIKDLSSFQIIEIINNLQRVKSHIGSLIFNGIFILIHFPHVRVTNEHDKFTDINHLWAKVHIHYNGTLEGGFKLNRSEYTILHMKRGYLHSHVMRIPKSDFTEFQSPCTGDGPINSTIIALNREYDEDIWNMFCLELSKYVTVESISGRPYHYLERLGTGNMEDGGNRFTPYTSSYYFIGALYSGMLKEFVKYFINQKKLKFNYVNNSYSIGMTLPEYITLISNEFISWYNDLFNKKKFTITFNVLKEKGLLKEAVIDNGKVYYCRNYNNNADNYSAYIGKKVCTFKGKEITVSITDFVDAKNNNTSIILDIKTALYILYIILKVLNYRYGRESNTPEDNSINSKVWYL